MRLLLGSIAGLALLLLAGCASTDSMSVPAATSGDLQEAMSYGAGAAGGVVGKAAPGAETHGSSTRRSSSPALASSRPGLGTGYGDYRHSSIEPIHFRRESDTPLATVTANYNDKTGIEAMIRRVGNTRRVYGPQPAGPEVTWSVRGANGRMLPTYRSGERLLVQGQPGERYSLEVRNDSSRRIEVVFSVDGLDVVDGQPASTSKRGYIVHPGASINIEGWRRNHHGVASFTFSSVANSYTQKRHGESRNVGVIGLAVFPEHYQSWYEREYRAQDTRHRANAIAFPKN